MAELGAVGDGETAAAGHEAVAVAWAGLEAGPAPGAEAQHGAWACERESGSAVGSWSAEWSCPSPRLSASDS